MKSWQSLKSLQAVTFFSLLGGLCFWVLSPIALGEKTYAPRGNNSVIERIPIERGAVDQDPGAELSQLITNGNFETGDFTGWTVKGDDFGTWVIFDENYQPASGAPPRPPFKGTYGAVTDQIGAGIRKLSQDIELPADSRAILLFADMIDNWAEVYDPELQLYRVDVVQPGTDNVLQNLFITKVGDPTHTPWTKRRFNLSRFAGQKIQIRFTEIDNLWFFNVWLDRVLVIAFGGSAAPPITQSKGTLATSWGQMKKGS